MESKMFNNCKSHGVSLSQGELSEDDYGIQECWGEMIDILCIDVQQTVTYLENCTPEELYYISEVFEDILERLQSKTFIECLRKLDKKFPNLKMTKDIDMAETYI